MIYKLILKVDFCADENKLSSNTFEIQAKRLLFELWLKGGCDYS